MNRTFLIIVIFSLFIATFTSLSALKKKRNKWYAVMVALLTNILILSTATALLYKVNVQVYHKETNGLFGSLGILVLAFFIPINTFVNYGLIEFIVFRQKTPSSIL